ncbi:MAG: TonB-dependent receptor, partial [Acidobacteria bacterium]|nr:TonB-dependent receptor [Acidobacteriota bacterium]
SFRSRRLGPAAPLMMAAALVAGIALLWATPARGQSSDGSSQQVGEVRLFGEEEFKIRAATKTELPLSKVPGSVSVISAQQIRESGAQTIPELLRLVAGVDVRWNPMVQTIDIRGFGQNPFTSRVLLLIDGVPYNSWNKGGFPQHPGFDFFMLQNIKRIEIVRGPGSSLYGENAYWGVINIVSLDGEDLQGGKVTAFGGDLKSQAGGFTYGKKVGEKSSFLVSGRAFSGQLPTAFWAEEADSEVKGSDVYVKGRIGGAELSYYRHEDDVDGFDVPGFIPGTRFRSADTISQTVEIAALKLGHRWGAGERYSFEGDVSYATRKGSRCAACHAAPANPAFSDEVDHGNQWIGDFRLGLRASKNHDLLVGIEGRRVETGDHLDELITPQQAGRDLVFEYDKLAAYFQDQISLASDRLRLTVGARYDGSNDLFEDELSPRIAAVWTASPKTVVRGGWSSAFRFPNFSELYQNSAFIGLDFGTFFRPLQVFQANPDLQPEEIRTIDLGVEHRFSGSFSAKLDLYRSEVKDFIVMAFNPLASGATAIRFENHPDDAELLGAELELRWRPSDRFTALFNWAYQEADQQGSLTASDGRPIEFVYAPEHKFNVGSYFGPFAGFRGAIEAQWRDERLGPSAWNFAGGGTTPVLDAYTQVNARLSWDAPFSFDRTGRGLRFTIYGKNLLDEEIVETFLPINQTLPGTTFYGAVELLF